MARARGRSATRTTFGTFSFIAVAIVEDPNVVRVADRPRARATPHPHVEEFALLAHGCKLFPIFEERPATLGLGHALEGFGISLLGRISGDKEILADVAMFGEDFPHTFFVLGRVIAHLPHAVVAGDEAARRLKTVIDACVGAHIAGGAGLVAKEEGYAVLVETELLIGLRTAVTNPFLPVEAQHVVVDARLGTLPLEPEIHVLGVVRRLYREVDDGSLALDGVVLCKTLGDELLAQRLLVCSGTAFYMTGPAGHACLDNRGARMAEVLLRRG